MSYPTLEVEVDHGKVVAKELAKLPDKARGLLTIFQPDVADPVPLSPLQALEALQKHLRLDAPKAAAWLTTVRDARRLALKELL